MQAALWRAHPRYVAGEVCALRLSVRHPAHCRRKRGAALHFEGAPGRIVHTAALSNTQYCQQEPEDSFRANVLLPEWVAKGAEEVGAKLLSCSSDQVYAGVTQRGRWRRRCPLPFHVYGQHKLEAEALVSGPAARGAVALRLPGCTTSRAIICPSGATCR